ncbi:Oocyte zinc finger protein [Trichinella pseudospiralis]|uniref:Oocyte zinc finger protein n=1 Tax=Trichinella pseudospiralis TaxID=6337 RepID=A0A0V0XLX5_TRIPS|nr:Oocyte zinc finger protein [Trichinella pseudospiralis]KRX88971.1 Oocyte zinc finger protein [Trichinella pseudospiralis]
MANTAVVPMPMVQEECSPGRQSMSLQNLMEHSKSKVNGKTENRSSYTTKTGIGMVSSEDLGDILDMQCELCLETFRNKKERLFHMRNVHDVEKPYRCRLCGKSFPYWSSLHNHRRLHLPDRPFVCSICSSCFRWKFCLKQHIIASHSTEFETRSISNDSVEEFSSPIYPDSLSPLHKTVEKVSHAGSFVSETPTVSSSIAPTTVLTKTDVNQKTVLPKDSQMKIRIRIDSEEMNDVAAIQATNNVVPSLQAKQRDVRVGSRIEKLASRLRRSFEVGDEPVNQMKAKRTSDASVQTFSDESSGCSGMMVAMMQNINKRLDKIEELLASSQKQI